MKNKPEPERPNLVRFYVNDFAEKMFHFKLCDPEWREARNGLPPKET